jgi:hypothetical protein
MATKISREEETIELKNNMGNFDFDQFIIDALI